MESKHESELNEYRQSLEDFREEIIKKVKESEEMIRIIKNKEEEIYYLKNELNIQNHNITAKDKGIFINVMLFKLFNLFYLFYLF